MEPYAPCASKDVDIVLEAMMSARKRHIKSDILLHLAGTRILGIKLKFYTSTRPRRSGRDLEI
jgi:hypothetical protein